MEAGIDIGDLVIFPSIGRFVGIRYIDMCESLFSILYL